MADEDRRLVVEGVSIALTTAGAAGVSVVGGPLAGAAFMATQPLFDRMVPAFADWASRSARGCLVWLGFSEADDGRGEERVEHLMSEPATQMLLRRAILIAADTADETKLALLGMALRQVADNPAAFDDEQLMIAALADVEAAHMRVLAVLARSALELGYVRAQPGATTVDDIWHSEAIASEDGRLTPAQVQALVQPLVLRGLAIALSTLGGGEAYVIAPLGRRLLERALAASAQPL